MGTAGRSAPRRPVSARQARVELRARLQNRRAEIEQAALTRVRAITGDSEDPGREQLTGLRRAIAAAVSLSISAVEDSEQSSPEVPLALLAQARTAARTGIKIETLLRRYSAGNALFCDFLIEAAAERGDLDTSEIKSLLRSQAALCDLVLAAASDEHARESARLHRSSEQRRIEQVERILAGEPLDHANLNYDFDAHHLAAIASGPQGEGALRELASSLDCRLLLIRSGEATAWAWLGSRHPHDEEELRVALADWPPGCPVALGESAGGLDGWRLTHRQALAALEVAQRGEEPVARYAEVALLAAVLRDDLLVSSLRKLYLEPLEVERDGGGTLRETLRAYFAAERNASSAAAALGVHRKTVTNRLASVEGLLERSLAACGLDLEVALALPGAKIRELTGERQQFSNH